MLAGSTALCLAFDGRHPIVQAYSRQAQVNHSEMRCSNDTCNTKMCRSPHLMWLGEQLLLHTMSGPCWQAASFWRA